MSDPFPALAALPARLILQGALNWTAQDTLPAAMREDFHHSGEFFGSLPFIDGDAQRTTDRIIAAAAVLLSESPTTLQLAGQRLLWEYPRKSGMIVSVLRTAACRETVPPWGSCDEDDDNDAKGRLPLVEDAVLFVCSSRPEFLTQAARQVLFGVPETNGAPWIMAVLKTAFRLASFELNGRTALIEKVSLDVPGPWPFGIFSCLQGVDNAEDAWLRLDDGYIWPYHMAELQYIWQARNTYFEEALAGGAYFDIPWIRRRPHLPF